MKRPLLLFLLGAAFLAAGPARAVVAGSTVGLELVSPGDGILLLDDVVVGMGPEIAPGDGSEIGSVLLSTEFIDLSVDRITLRIEEGLPGGSTGYANNARFVFNDLYAGTGLGIDTLTPSYENISGVSILSNKVRVEVFIDDALIGDQTGIDFGTIILDFTTAVPEPGAAFLCLFALAALGARMRR